jgi:hypothetical protein
LSVEEIKDAIKVKLKNQLITSRVLIDRLRLIDEDSRKSSQYQDPRYLPFYYYLSRSIHPKSIVNLGLDLALPLCCFLQGADTAESVVCLQRASKDFYSPRLALSNIKDIKGKKINVDYYYGDVIDSSFIQKLEKNCDLVISTERINNDKINESLEVCWQYLNVDGFIVVDHIHSNESIGEIFRSFCKGQNRPFVEFETRYGTGLVQK